MTTLETLLVILFILAVGLHGALVTLKSNKNIKNPVHFIEFIIQKIETIFLYIWNKIKSRIYLHIAIVASSLFIILASVRDLFNIDVINSITDNENLQVDIVLNLLLVVMFARSYITIKTDDNSIDSNWGIAITLLITVLLGVFLTFRYVLSLLKII